MSNTSTKTKFQPGDTVLIGDKATLERDGLNPPTDTAGCQGVVLRVEPSTGDCRVQIEDDPHPWLYSEASLFFLKSRGPTSSNVIKPNHYAIRVKGSEFDVIDLIQSLDIGFELGNALKYIIRAGKKADNPTAQDLEKAMECIRRRVQFINAQTQKEGE